MPRLHRPYLNSRQSRKVEEKMSFERPKCYRMLRGTRKVRLCASGANDGLRDQWGKTPIAAFETLVQG